MYVLNPMFFRISVLDSVIVFECAGLGFVCVLDSEFALDSMCFRICVV